MDPKPQLVGVVIRKDGTVPFDADCHPDVRAAVMQHLHDAGHELEHPSTCSHHKGHGCDCSSPRIKNWSPK